MQNTHHSTQQNTGDEETPFEIVRAGLHCDRKMSKHILPLEFILGWYIFVVNAIYGRQEHKKTGNEYQQTGYEYQQTGNEHKHSKEEISTRGGGHVKFMYVIIAQVKGQSFY